jgi:predicted RNA methylase
MDFSEEIKRLSGIDLFDNGTLEMYHGGCYPDKTSFCGACWQYLKQNDIPGQRIIDWNLFEEDIEDILNALNHNKADKNHPDYIFLQTKLSLAKANKRIVTIPDLVYTDIELLCLTFEAVGNRLNIPKDIFIPNYSDVKLIMKNFDGVYKKNGFEFKFPADQVLNRIRNKETTNLKKTFQYFGTPKKLCKIMCEKAFDPYENKKLKILEPSAGQGAIIDSILEWFEEEAVNTGLDSITAIELMDENYQVLIDKYSSKNPLIKILKMDFLDYDKYINHFDVVIANPPFSKGQDMKHFYKMYEVCKPGGIVVSIMSNGFLYNSTKLYKEFRDFLQIPYDSQTRAAAKGGSTFVRTLKNSGEEVVCVVPFDSGEFKESGTNVHTVMVSIVKNTISSFKESIEITKNEQLKLF